ncbi:MAG TPA: protease SohB, partial [Fontimonas sp.]
MLTGFLDSYLLFLAKSATIIIVLMLIITMLINTVRQLNSMRIPDQLDVRDLNARFQNLADSVRESIGSDAERKTLHKRRKKEAKTRQKGSTRQPRVFVLNFKGDLHAHATESLREEVSAILQVAADGDEVLVRLESEGGLVHAYGLAASQLARFKPRGVRLTVSVDKVAASGGYMMACVADRIIAAPFAVLGSIGVVAQLPNFNRLLKKLDVDYELHTAGEFKRTLTLFGQNTDEGREKFQEEIDQTHALFKAFVGEHRPQLDLSRVATGEHWFGSQALELKLIDAIETSDDFLLQRADGS